jgi:hypothetical protein
LYNEPAAASTLFTSLATVEELTAELANKPFALVVKDAVPASLKEGAKAKDKLKAAAIDSGKMVFLTVFLGFNLWILGTPRM